MTTATKPTVKFFFRGEHTTLWSKDLGLVPSEDCGHEHRTYDAAWKCREGNDCGLLIVYARMSNGKTADAPYIG
jgi:hypothetical protein